MLLKPAYQYVLKFLSLVIFLGQSTVGMSQFTVGGTASSLGGDCFQLTTTSNSQAGYVYQNQPINLNESFDMKFEVYLGTNNGGADGIVFVLRGALGAPYIGSVGGAIGYNGSGFSTNSLGVEVDTWFNGIYSDIAADHIGILKNGTVDHGSANSLAGPIQASVNTADVEDGNFHTLNVRWDPVAQNLEVYLDCDYRLQHSGDIINNIFNGDTLVHWGFLGTTGGANNVQQFCFATSIDSLVEPLSDATICAGDSVQLDAGDGAVNYSWSPATGLSATNVEDPWAYPNTTTSYYVEASYNCDTLYDTAKVTVLQPTFDVLDTINDALCKNDCNGAINIDVINGSGMYTYQWSNSQTTQDIINLCNGTYTVTIQDVDTGSSTYLCTTIKSYTVNEPLLLTSGMVNPTKTSCPDGTTCDASATVLPQGGTSPFSYLWSSGETTATANLLCADTNRVTITDANGCTKADYIVIDIPDSISTTAFGDTMICISNIASIVGAATGGTPPYSYTWHKDSLDGIIVSTSQTVSVTPDTTTEYFVESTDANGCFGDTSKVLVKVRPPLSLDIENIDTICPYDTIPIVVTGFGGDSTHTFSWSSGHFGNTIYVSPNQSTWYAVTISDACGTPPFADSVFVQVGGYQDIEAEIRVEDDSLCAGESSYLIASGIGGYKGPKEYIYNWGHTSDKNPVVFVSPGKTHSYTVSIKDKCLSRPGTATATINVGRPAKPSLSAFPPEACAFADVTLVIDSFKQANEYVWLFADSTRIESEGLDTVYTSFSESGCHDVKLRVTTPYGCTSSHLEKCAVRIRESPTAAYTSNPVSPSNVEGMVQFENTSLNAVYSVWYIDGDTLENVDVFQKYYPDSLSDLSFRLVAVSEDGCSDTLDHNLDFKYRILIYYPNSFTPNGDNKNEVFKVVGEDLSSVDFELRIFDRWGRQVFRSVDPSYGWNGKFPDGNRAPQGVYPFTLQYRDNFGDLIHVRDQVTISVSGHSVPLR